MHSTQTCILYAINRLINNAIIQIILMQNLYYTESVFHVSCLVMSYSPSLCCWGMIGGGWGKAWLICPYAAGKAAETHTHTRANVSDNAHEPVFINVLNVYLCRRGTFTCGRTGGVTDLHTAGLPHRPAEGDRLRWDSELQRKREGDNRRER